MAKTKKESTEVAVRQEAGVPANYMDDLMAKYAGAGTSQKAEDNLVPMLYILQDNSPQVKKRDPKYIQGAEPGMWVLNNPPRLFADTEKGLIFQPCYFWKAIVEWRPRAAGGGVVNSYEEWPDGAEERPHPEDPSRKIMKLGDNDLVDTRYHAGHIVEEDGSLQPAVIPFKSTGHTISKGWMVLMNAHKRNGLVMPSFTWLYRLKTTTRENVHGSFFVADIQNYTPVENEHLLEAGVNLMLAFQAGDKRADHSGEQQEGGRQLPF